VIRAWHGVRRLRERHAHNALKNSPSMMLRAPRIKPETLA